MSVKQRQASGKCGSSTHHVKKHPDNQSLKDRILLDLVDLPSMPHIVTKALDIISAEDSGLKELVSVIKTDPAVAAKTLKLANSAYYGLSGKVGSIQQAVVLLGSKIVANLIIMAGAADLLEKSLKGYGLEARDLWRHSLSVAFGSRMIGSRTAPDLMEDAFAAALLHDSGKVVLNKYILERKTAFDEFMKDSRHSFIEAEAHILGVDHSEIAFEMCMNWNIPETLCSAIRYCPFPSQSQGNKLAYIVHVAEAIAKRSEIGTDMKDMMQYRMEDGAMEFLNLKVEDLKHIMDKMVEAVGKTIETVINA